MTRMLIAGIVLLTFATTLVPTGSALSCMEGTPQQMLSCWRSRLLDGDLGCVHVAESHGDGIAGAGLWEEDDQWVGAYAFVDGGDADFGIFAGVRPDCGGILQ